MFKFSEEQMQRYARHLILGEIGGEGQEKILSSRVLCVGAGGLGSPAAFYLAAAGVGRLGIVDSDVVDLSNLQRQILHSTADVGRPKVESARARLQALNPDCRVITHKERLTSQNILNVVKDYDVILDCSDNFPTRYLVNDACVMAGKPLAHAGIFRLEGQIITIIPGRGPCYRCVFPEPPPPELVPSGREVGVLGAVVGVLGALLATEVLKIILGKGDLLIGRLLVFNALELSFREAKVGNDKQCAICGEHPTITKLIDYEEFCQSR